MKNLANSRDGFVTKIAPGAVYIVRSKGEMIGKNA